MRGLVLLLLVSCGGKFVDVDDTQDASAPNDAGTSTDSATKPPKDAGKPDCRDMELRREKLRPQVTQCCAQCDSIQCTVRIEDVCCPISVNARTPQVVEYEALVKDYLAACGPVACPAVECAPQPSKVCNPDTSRCQ